MALNDGCTTCKKRKSCTVECKKIEKILTADSPKKKPEINFLGNSPIEYKDDKELEINLDGFRKIDTAIGIRSITDSDLDRNFDTGPNFEPPGLVLNTKLRDTISEYTKRCQHKEKNFQKNLFDSFLRCNPEKKLVMMTGKREQVIQKYLARICKCIVEWLVRRSDEDLKSKIDLANFHITPLQFKKKFIIQRGLP